MSGFCGNIRDVHWGHCDCDACVDFSREAVEDKPAALRLMNDPANGGGSEGAGNTGGDGVVEGESRRSIADNGLTTSVCQQMLSIGDAGWAAELAVCKPLFSDADYEQGKDSKVTCRQAASEVVKVMSLRTESRT